MVKKTVQFEGKLYESMAELARQKGVVDSERVTQRIKKGWSLEKALKTPKNATKKTKADYHRLAEKKGWKWVGESLPESTETDTKWLCVNHHPNTLTFRSVRNSGKCWDCYLERVSDPAYVNPRSLKASDYQGLANEKGWKWVGNKVPKNKNAKTTWEIDHDHKVRRSYESVKNSLSAESFIPDYKTAYGKQEGLKPPPEESLAVTHPKLAKEWHRTKNGNLKPEYVYAGWSDVAWWHCPKSKLPEHPHDYDMPIKDRGITGYNCPYCSGSRVAPDTCLEYLFPDIAAEWHPTKNGELKPGKVTKSYSEKVHWFCPLHPDDEWYVSPAQRTSRDGTGCPHCQKKTSKVEIRIYTELKAVFDDVEWGQKVLKQEVDIFLPSLRIGVEYDSKRYHAGRGQQDERKKDILEKHGYTLLRLREEGLPLIGDNDVEVPVDGGQREVIRLLYSRLSSLVSKEDHKKIRSYLSRKKFANDEEYREKMARLRFSPAGESFKDTHPEIAKFWDYERNFPRTPDMDTAGSQNEVWWKCAHKNYHPSFSLSIVRRAQSKHYKCEYCWGKNRKVHKRDSLRALHPELLKDWDYEKNELLPEKVWPKWTESNYRAFWRCSECGHEWRSAPYNRVQGSACPHARWHG